MNGIAGNSGINQMMLNYFSKTNAMTAKQMQQIASGHKINRAADDAAGLAIAKKMNAQITGISAASQNTQDAVSMLQVADGALSGVGDITNRMEELAMKASNGTLGDEERQMIQEEFSQLSQEIDRIGQSTTFNGNKLFDGSSYQMQIGDTASQTMKVDMKEMSAAALGLDKVDLTSAEGAGKALDSIKSSINSISSQRATYGAAENRLKTTYNSLTNNEINLTDSMSKIMDTDIAKASTRLNSSRVMGQVSIAMMQNAQYLIQSNAANMLLR